MKFIMFGYQVCKRTWKKLIFRPIHFIFSFVQPIFWLTIFGYLFERQFNFENGSYLSYLLPGVCAMTVIQSSSQSGILFIKDFQTSFFGRYHYTPVSKVSFLFFKIFADFSRIILQVFILIGIGSILGIEGISLNFSSIVLICAGAFLFTFFYASISSLIALRTKTPEIMSTFINLFNLPIIFTSTALVPNKNLPTWLEDIAKFNPLSHLSGVFRYAFISVDFGNIFEPSLSLTLLFGLSLLTFLGCFIYLRRIIFD